VPTLLHGPIRTEVSAPGRACRLSQVRYDSCALVEVAWLNARSSGVRATYLGHICADEYIVGHETGRVLSAEEAHAILTACAPEIRALGVVRLALFGSVLRGEASPESDVDLLVEFSPGAKSFDAFMALADLLEDRLGHAVELVTLEALSPFIGPKVLAEAKDVLRAA
jgi:uncharacterized protein